MKYFFSFLGILTLLLALSQCQPDPHAEGKRLAGVYCGNCHLVPAPTDLTREIWLTEVLPLMGAFYGIYEGKTRQSYLKNDAEAAYIGQVYPLSPRLDSLEWTAIKDYFLDGAADVLELAEPSSTLLTMDQFKVHPVVGPAGASNRPLTTLIATNPVKNEIIAGGQLGNQGIVHHYSFDHQHLRSAPTISPPVAYNDQLQSILEIGSLVPSDLPLGRLRSIADSTGIQTLRDSLRRPLDVIVIDLDLDGQSETIVAEYGNMTGRLRAYPAQGPPYNLTETPGAIRLRASDLNNDGKEDLIVLFAQGDERIDVFFASKDGAKRQNLLRFPPSYGSSDLELADYDGDGDSDLIYTNGDNYDYQPIPKPYHGIRVFENNGRNEFSEAWFYPMDGAYGVEADDFDGDGDIDLAAIAYFIPPVKRSIYSFVYLEQQSKKKFQPFGFEKSSGQHFICMTKADTDQDGDQDLLIGNFSNYLPDGGASGYGKKGVSPLYLWLENQGEKTN
ncbi:MAG: FG-GAP repeat domain-containing protein [Lewinella sp.]